MPTYRYHWTHRSNLQSIALTGLDPAFARGKMRVVWSCDSSRLMWACHHVARHHQCAEDEMVLLRVRVDALPLTRSSWPGVMVCPVRVAPSRIAVRLNILDARWTAIRKVT